MAVDPYHLTIVEQVWDCLPDAKEGGKRVQKRLMSHGLGNGCDTFHARIHAPEDVASVLDLFLQYGHVEVDTARVYGDGTSEELLSEVDWQKRGIVMDTKLYPNVKYTHSPKDVRSGLMDSLEALKTDKVDMFYLHGPDRTVPFEETLLAVNELYKEGYFNRFGISNFLSYEVAKICEICEKNGWIKPTVYQGNYSALQRSVEAELFPCLRHYGISLYAFQPLAAGFLTGRYQRSQIEFEEGSRFDSKQRIGKVTQGRYINDSYFDALDLIKEVADKHRLTIAEIALRWLEHHSLLKEQFGDAIIIGSSSLKHVQENLADLEKGPLPEEVVEFVEQAWLKAKPVAPRYFH
ncbi:NADP-dependent oxidoreductase domain-containing protein [Leptodontidium sp. 2 PMI_412]|nr:NADP-dependent oxidoreductase domain-containing protein [Leptodontidium sp. 2 PMI_412]